MADQDKRDVTERYEKTGNEDTGITNRPIEEEIDNQDALPERGSSRDEDPDRTSDSERGPDR